MNTQEKIDLFLKAVKDGEVTESMLDEIVAPLSTEADEANMLDQELDPSPTDPRAVMAEYMLDQYHLLKTNLKTREAIHRTLHDRGALSTHTQEAYQMVIQAQAELDQCKYEILELMGVDS